MTQDWRNQNAPQNVVVTHVQRDQAGHHALTSMTGPEFTGVGAIFAPLALLPVGLRVVVLAGLVLIGMAGCTAAWIDYQDYVPVPNVCRPDQYAAAQQLGCVVPGQVPAEGAR